MARNAKDRSSCCSRLWLFGAIMKKYPKAGTYVRRGWTRHRLQDRSTPLSRCQPPRVPASHLETVGTLHSNHPSLQPTLSIAYADMRRLYILSASHIGQVFSFDKKIKSPFPKRHFSKCITKRVLLASQKAIMGVWIQCFFISFFFFFHFFIALLTIFNTSAVQFSAITNHGYQEA